MQGQPASRSIASRRSSVLLVFLAATLLWATPAHAAKKRVVVLGFSGPQAAGAEATVGTIVSTKNTLVSAAQYSKSQKRLRLKSPTNANVAKIAADIQVDAIIAGVVQRKGARWQLMLVVREGASGAAVGTLNVPLRSPRIDTRAKQDIASVLLPAIAKTSPIGGGGGAVASNGGGGRKKKKIVAPPPEDDTTTDDSATTDEEPEPPPPPKKHKKKVVQETTDDEETPAPPPPKKKVHKKKPDSEDENPLTPAPDESSDDSSDEPTPHKTKKIASNDDESSSDDTSDDSAVVRKKKHHDDDGGAPVGIVGGKYARNAGADLAAGMSFTGRTLTFNFSSSLMPNQQPNGYKGAVVPGVFVNAEVYPLAFSKPSSIGAGVGLALELDRVISLQSRLGAMTYPTSQTAYGVGLRFRLPLGKKPTLPSLKFGAGLQHLDFTISAPAGSIDLPNVSYSYVDLLAGMRVPLGTPKFSLDLAFRFLAVLASGDFSNTSTGYGTGTTSGVDIMTGLEVRPTDRLTIRAGFRYTRIAFAFDGNGDNLSTNRDMDPSTKDVGGALDQYIGGYATVGWLF